MKALSGLILGLALTVVTAVAQETAGPPAETVRFRAVDVYLDCKDKALAAYQLEVSAASDEAKIVGIEGGEHPAFNSAPFYDPKAIQNERVIIAAYNTGSADKLPKGKTRVATIHFQVSGSKEPEYAVKLTTAATVNGRKIPVIATLERKTSK